MSGFLLDSYPASTVIKALFLAPSRSVPISSACPAVTRPVCWMQIGVALIVVVTSWAMRLGSLLRTTLLAGFAALHVGPVGDRLQMSRSYALRVSAEVIQLITSRDWSTQKLVGEAVGANQSLPIPEIAIAQGDRCCSPLPAAISLLDFWPEALLWRLGRPDKAPGDLIVNHVPGKRTTLDTYVNAGYGT